MTKYYSNLSSFEDWDNHLAAVRQLTNSDTEVLKAIKIAKKEHDEPRFYYKGTYNRHPLRVARILLEEFNVKGTEIIVTALCHDLLEWTDYKAEDIRTEFGDQVYDNVQLLTWGKEQTWENFVKQIIENGDTNLIKLKMADKLDNNRGTVFVKDKTKHKKAYDKTENVMKHIIQKYSPEHWHLFEEIQSLLNTN